MAHPLSNFSKVEKVWIDGHEYFDRDQDVEGRSKKEIEKKALTDKAAPAAGGRGAQTPDRRRTQPVKRFLLFLAPVLAGCRARRADDSFVIRGATVHTMAGAEIQNGSVIVRNGKIIGVGKNLAVPKDLKVIDGKGMQVYPGMIDAATEVGLAGSQLRSRDAGHDGNR